MSRNIHVYAHKLNHLTFGSYLAWGDYFSLGLGKRELVIEFE